MKKILIDTKKLGRDLMWNGWGIAEIEAIIKAVEKSNKIEVMERSLKNE